VAITAQFEDSRQTSGCRRITAALNAAGLECSVGLVADLMRELGLASVQPRAHKRTTWPGEEVVVTPDLTARDFTTTGAPGERLVGDITYLRTGEGWLHLATVIDLTTRMVLGWQLAHHMRTSLITEALQMGLDSGHVQPNAIFYSDRGTQHTSADFVVFTTKNDIRRSVGRTGVCWDNAAAESSFARLGTRCTTGSHLPPEPARGSPSRSTSRCSTTVAGLHSTLGYRAPRSKRSPITRLRHPPRPDRTPDDLFKVLDTAQATVGRDVRHVRLSTTASGRRRYLGPNLGGRA